MKPTKADREAAVPYIANAAREVCDLLELADQRELALDGPVGDGTDCFLNLTNEEKRRFYMCCKQLQLMAPEREAGQGGGRMKPTKDDRDLANIMVAVIIPAPPWVADFVIDMDKVRQAIARHMTPERKRARRERDVRDDLVDACYRTLGAVLEADMRDARLLCGNAIAAAEALDKPEVKDG